MLKSVHIHWKSSLVTLLSMALVFLAVIVAPNTNRGHAPIILTLVIIVFLYLLGIGKSVQPVRMIDISVLALVLALGISVILSIEPHRSWIWAAGISGGLIAMMATREVVRKWIPANQILAGLMATGLIFQTILTVEVLKWLIEWRIQFPELTVPPQSYRFSNGNGWAGYLVPLIFLQLGIFFSTKNTLSRWVTSIGILWTLVLIYFTSSRGGMIGLAAGGLTFIIVERSILWEWIRPVWNKLAGRRWLLQGIGIAGLIGIAAVGWIMFQAIEAHPTHGSFGLESRTPFWIPAWNAFIQSPLFGNGIFTQAGYYMATTSIPPNGLYFHSHNMYLDILAGMGLIGAAAAAWFIIELSKGLLRSRRNAPKSAAPIVMAAFPVSVGFLTHSLFDSLYWLPIISIPLAIIFGTALTFDDRKLKIKFPGAQIAAVLTLVIIWGLYVVQQPYLQALAFAEEENLAATTASLDKAVNRFSISPLFNREAGYAHAEQAAAGEPGELQKAIDRFETAIKHDPNFSVNWLNLGALKRTAGDLKGSREALETATVKAEKWGLTWLNLGATCEAAGDEACARNAYMKALDLHPSWTADPYWQGSPLREAAVTAARAAAYSNAPAEPLTMDEVIRQGYIRPVLEMANQKIEEGELEDAERLLKVAPYYFIQNDLEKVDLLWLQAELSAAQGDLDRAVETGTQARQKFEDNRLNGSVAAGVEVYGSGIYQLNTLGIDLVPQVIWMQYPGDWENRMSQLKSWQE